MADLATLFGLSYCFIVLSLEAMGQAKAIFK
jgi:hypothetical protein